ncbi:MAG TPA: hypothetical protein VIY49_24020 [Bryobacteraceae bacterium]
MRPLLTGGDRRSLARADQARLVVEDNPARIAELAELAEDGDWRVSLRALDLLEKLVHEHVEWIEPYKRVFLGSCTRSDKWEVRLQMVRALPLFKWTGRDAARAKAILLENLTYPQAFVKAWALDSLATFAVKDGRLMPAVRAHLEEFEKTGSKALQARARRIRQRLAARPE